MADFRNARAELMRRHPNTQRTRRQMETRARRNTQRVIRVLALADSWVVVEYDTNTPALIKTRRHERLDDALGDVARYLERAGLLVSLGPVQKGSADLDGLIEVN